MNDLVKIESTEIATVFQAGGLDPYIQKIKAEAATLVPDVSTDKGRKEIASMARKVARSKTYLDGLGKELVSGIKKQAKVIDAERKNMRDTLDQVRDDTRRPLDEFEAAAKARIDAIYARIAEIREAGDVVHDSLDGAELALKAIDSIRTDDSFDEFAGIAENAKAQSVMVLNAQVITLREAARVAEEAAQAERDRQAKEQQEREERIAREATDRARKLAEQSAQKEADRIERERKAREAIIEQERREQEEADKKEADRKERELKEATDKIERAKTEAKRAADQAIRDQQEAVENERKRAEQAQRAEAEAEQRRAADREHRATVNNAAMDALAAAGVPKTHAKKVITAIAKGEVPNVQIRY